MKLKNYIKLNGFFFETVSKQKKSCVYNNLKYCKVNESTNQVKIMKEFKKELFEHTHKYLSHLLNLIC